MVNGRIKAFGTLLATAVVLATGQSAGAAESEANTILKGMSDYLAR